jgi:UDP-3-O-acyl-N-acetylglucosamine deacetylase
MAESAVLAGVGLFSGKHAQLRLLPGRGLRIRRVAYDQVFEAPVSVDLVTTDASWAGVGIPIRNTTLSVQGQIVATVEHVFSALAGLGVWNATIELHATEVPILDGSALPFLEAARTLATRTPAAPQASPISLSAPVRVEDAASGAWIDATPAKPDDQPHYTYRLDYGPTAPIHPHEASWRVGDPAAYARDIAPARTFSLLAEARAAQAAGLFRHLSPQDMLVIGDDGQPLDNAFRMSGEPARHKLLDLVGDLALLGGPLWANVAAHKAGHALTHRFVREALRVGVAR